MSEIRRSLLVRTVADESVPDSFRHDATKVQSKYQKAYHGSPYRFDVPDMRNVGSGEGFNAYGWGMYFATRVDVAAHYQRSHLSNEAAIRQMALDEEVSDEAADSLSKWYFETRNGNLFDKFMQTMRSSSPSRTIAEHRERVLAHEPALRRAWERFTSCGHLYLAEIPAEGELLDWDASLDNQSDRVKASIRRLLAGQRFPKDWDDVPLFLKNRRHTGASLFAALARSGVSPIGDQAASKLLQRYGIPGLMYLDGGSREQRDGTRNYVIWDEARIRLLERDGVSISRASRVSPSGNRGFDSR